ncbi:MAG TPA: hypothetical protein VGK29_12145 [Paludibaculum sp.]|jgi:hypothetical protein
MKTLPLIAGLLLGSILPAATPNFSEHIAPIIFNNCTTCHRPGEAGPFPFTSYEEVAKRGKMIAAITKARTMPPWQAEKTAYPFANERTLTAAQIDLIQEWVRAGMPRGNAALQPPLPKFPQGWELGKPDLIVKMSKSFRVPAEGTDIYRHFAFPIGLPEDKWVRAIEFRPGARSVVHHALLYFDTAALWPTLDGKDGKAGFDEYNSPVAKRQRVATWAVGSNPRTYPEGIAVKLPKGADLVVQTHFHPTGKEEDEISTVGIYFADAPPAKTWTELQLPYFFGIGAGIDIPAGDPAYTVTESITLPVDVEAFAGFAHAHFLGKEFRLTAVLPSGQTQNLLWVKKWDFAWQTIYNFQDRVSLPKGTKLTARIVWDNSTANSANQFNPPRAIRWGEASTDEMGSITLDIVPARETELPALTAALRQHRQMTDASRVLSADRALENGVAGLGADEAKLATAVLGFFDTDKDGKLSPTELESARATLRAQGFDTGLRRSSLPQQAASAR